MSLGVLGGGAASKKMARPLSYGRGFDLGHLRGALGASSSSWDIPSNCWDTPGFKDCHATSYAQAQKYCADGGATFYDNDMEKCIDQKTVSSTWFDCVPQICPQDKVASKTPNAADYPWGVKADKTRALQIATNVALAKAGLCPITVDGKLGGATCGARNHLTLLGPGVFSNPSTCDGHQNELKIPAKKSSGCGSGGGLPKTPSPTVSPRANPMVAEAGMSSTTKRVLGFALGGVLAIGAVVMLRKKR